MMTWGNLSLRCMRVWQRNFVVYRKIWLVNFLPPLLEPLFYLLAFGVGLSTLIKSVHYEGAEISYLAFIAPSLLAINIMQNAFFENTYASFVRMYYQKTFDAMMSAPLSLEEVIAGEILWGATKSLIGTTIMMVVISAFGLVQFPLGLLMLPLSLLAGFAFGSIGMIFTGIVPSIDMYNLPVFLFITPMFLFSGTFFPIDQLPAWAQHVAYALPLTHVVDLSRSLCLGTPGIGAAWSLVYLLGFSTLCFPLALSMMHRRLIH